MSIAETNEGFFELFMSDWYVYFCGDYLFVDLWQAYCMGGEL